MNRIVILLAVSILVCAAAVGQSSNRVFSLYGDSDRGWLGVSVQDVTKKLAEREGLRATAGAYVSDVVSESPAETAGILKGDVIVKFGTRLIDDGDDLIAAVRKTDPGDEVPIVVNRGGETKTLRATLDEMEPPRAYSLTIPRVPGIPRLHVAPFPGGGFFRSGESLGLEMQDLGKQLAEYFEVPGNRGVLVTSVARKSSAEKAGIKAGDVILRVNRNTVRDVDDVLEELRDAEGEHVPFDLMRKGKSLTLSVDVEKDSGETSFFDNRAREELREALRGAKERARHGSGWARELKESLKEMKKELKENLRDLGNDLRESIRSL